MTVRQPDTFTRVPNPEEKFVAPLIRVSANVPVFDNGPPACGGTAFVSSVVAPPTAIAPLSRTLVGVVE